MDKNKIEEIQLYMKKVALKENLKYKIVVIKNAYFFFLDENENSIKNFYENNHEYVKGWYTGVLSFKASIPNTLYVFISEILCDNVDAKSLFLRILYQTLIYLNPNISKLKIKKLRKKLKNYLLNVFQDENFIEEDVDAFLNDKRDLQLFNKAEILIPHLSLYNLIEKINFENDLTHLGNVKSYLKPFEYIPLCPETHVHHEYHHHNH